MLKIISTEFPIPSIAYQIKKVFACLSLLLCVFSNLAHATVIQLTVADDLQQVIDLSEAGDTLKLAAKEYNGNFEISHAITLQGADGTVINSQGMGNSLFITADDVVIKDLDIKNWGSDLTETNSAIKVKNAKNIELTGNNLRGDGFGIYLEKSADIIIENNTVWGNSDMRSSDRGNGIHLSNVQNVRVLNNSVSHTRDGLYIINSQKNELRANVMADLRFGVHYMYSHNNVVADNETRNVKVGYALMSSRDLTITGNTAHTCEDYGLLLNFVNTSTFSDNYIDTIRSGNNAVISGDEGKALFVYNSTNNIVTNNTFANSDMGIHLTAGSEGNKIYSNNFVNNEIQVKYVSSRTQEWSEGEVGNYWSNYIGWDLNDDGIGDSEFEPNDGVDKLLWKYPESKVLMDSPAVLLLRWVQKSFPVLQSPGVKDSFPLFKIVGAER